MKKWVFTEMFQLWSKPSLVIHYYKSQKGRILNDLILSWEITREKELFSINKLLKISQYCT